MPLKARVRLCPTLFEIFWGEGVHGSFCQLFGFDQQWAVPIVADANGVPVLAEIGGDILHAHGWVKHFVF